MTDITKYRNVSLTHETYKTLISLSKVLLPDARLSISKTVECLANEKAKNLTARLKGKQMIAICHNCKGNGYIKIKNEEDQQIYIHQCWQCESKAKLNMKIVILIGIIFLLSSCTKADYDFNPWTTVLKEVIIMLSEVV